MLWTGCFTARFVRGCEERSDACYYLCAEAEKCRYTAELSGNSVAWKAPFSAPALADSPCAAMPGDRDKQQVGRVVLEQIRALRLQRCEEAR